MPQESKVRLRYGIGADGHLKDVRTVPRGVACGCICPCCKGALVARQGALVVPHFAHANRVECEGAHETELHLLAKAIIHEQKGVMLPGYGIVYKGGRQYFDKVEVEVKDASTGLQPDLVGERGGHRLWMEIRVSHEVGPEKQRLMCEHGIAGIEIDLRAFMDKEADKDVLSRFLLESKEQRSWICNPVLQRKADDEVRQQKDVAEMLGDRMEDARQKLLEQLNRGEITPEEYQKATGPQLQKGQRLVNSRQCYLCRHHTLRQPLREYVRQQKLPKWVQFVSDVSTHLWTDSLLLYTIEGVAYVNAADGCHYLPLTAGEYASLSPAIRQEIPGDAEALALNARLVSFFEHDLSDFVRREGNRCAHRHHSIREAHRFAVVCQCTKVRPQSYYDRKGRGGRYGR